MTVLNPNRTSRLDFFGVQQSNHFFDGPNAVRNPGFHCWRHSDGFVNATKVIMHVVNRNRSDMILNFFEVRVCQASETSHSHSHREVLALDKTGGNVLRIETARDNHFAASDAFGGTVPRITP